MASRKDLIDVEDLLKILRTNRDARTRAIVNHVNDGSISTLMSLSKQLGAKETLDALIQGLESRGK